MSSRDSLRSLRPKIHKHEYEGQVFHIRSLSGAGRAKYLEIVSAAGDGNPSMAKIVALGLAEEDGTLTYNCDNDKDIAEINETEGDVLHSIASRIFEVSGLAKKAPEEAEKKS